MNVDDSIQANATPSLGIRATCCQQRDINNGLKSSQLTTAYGADGTASPGQPSKTHRKSTPAHSPHKVLEQPKRRILGVLATTSPAIEFPCNSNHSDEGDVTVASIGPNFADLLSDDDVATSLCAVVAEDDSSFADSEEQEIVTASGRDRLRALVKSALPVVSRSSWHTQRQMLVASDGTAKVRNETVPEMTPVADTNTSIRNPIPSRKLYSYVDYDTARDRSAKDLLHLLGGQACPDPEQRPVVTKRTSRLPSQNSMQPEHNDNASILNISKHLSFRPLCVSGAVEAAEDDGPSGLSRSQGRGNPFDLLEFKDCDLLLDHKDCDLLLDHFVDGADWTSIEVDIVDQQMQTTVAEVFHSGNGPMRGPLLFREQQRLPQRDKRPAVHRSLFRGIEMDDNLQPSIHSRSESKADDASHGSEDFFAQNGSSVDLLDSSGETERTRPRDSVGRDGSSWYLDTSPGTSSDEDDDELLESLSTLQLLFGSNERQSELSPSSESGSKLEDSSSSFDQIYVVQQERPSCSSISTSGHGEEKMNRIPRTMGAINVKIAPVEPKSPLRSCIRRPEPVNLNDSGHMKPLARKVNAVKFGKISIREYEMSVADTIPTCGVPVGLAWSYYAETVSDIMIFEAECHREQNRTSRPGCARSMSAKEREKLLIDTWGMKKSKVRKARRKADAARAIRNETRQEEIIKNGILFEEIRGGTTGNIRWLPDVDDDRWPLPKG